MFTGSISSNSASKTKICINSKSVRSHRFLRLNVAGAYLKDQTCASRTYSNKRLV